MKALNPETLVPLNAFRDAPIIVDLVYAKPRHPDNHFPDLYDASARILWAHEDIAAVTLLASYIVQRLYAWSLKINDCLRPVEAQERMAQYGYDPSLVSTPGSGAHPRAMAIDVEPLLGSLEYIKKYFNPVLLGTRFDFFSSDPEHYNPAARAHDVINDPEIELSDFVYFNRLKLEKAMCDAARALGHDILPLPQEWWDFRFRSAVWEQYHPLHEEDLLPCQRLIDVDGAAMASIIQGDYPDFMNQRIRDIDRKVKKAFNGMKGLRSAEPDYEVVMHYRKTNQYPAYISYA